MSSIVIEAKNRKDLQLLKELSEKMGLSAYFLNQEQKEDINFGRIMDDNNADNLTLNEAKAYYQQLKKNADKL